MPSKPLVDGLVEFRLPRAEDFRHRGHAAVHFRLRLQDLGQPRLRLGGAACCLGIDPRARPVRAPERQRQPDNKQQCGDGKANQRLAKRDDVAIELENGRQKRVCGGYPWQSLADSCPKARSKREQALFRATSLSVLPD
jgi:hypothetical protein